VWEEQQKAKEGSIEASSMKKRKRFCDAKSGTREGKWMVEGQQLFNRLCEEVKQLRNEPETGKKFDETMRIMLRETAELQILPQLQRLYDEDSEPSRERS